MSMENSSLDYMKMTGTSDEDSPSLKELLLIVFSSAVFRKYGSLYTRITSHYKPCSTQQCLGHMGKWCDCLGALKQIMLKAFKQKQSWLYQDAIPTCHRSCFSSWNQFLPLRTHQHFCSNRGSLKHTVRFNRKNYHSLTETTMYKINSLLTLIRARYKYSVGHESQCGQ